MAFNGWRALFHVAMCVAVLAGAGVLAQALAPTDGLFCYTSPNKPPQCFDTLGKAEQAMRAAPDNTVVGPLLVDVAPLRLCRRLLMHRVHALA